ncbi:MAG: hypothetical protein DMG17_13980 [Acidobacteria bacterium]|nr:MAG: hypothetical protein DMG17_13980 [Acidobacteriota bacterium]
MSKQRPTPMNTRFTRKIEPGPGKPRVKLPGGLHKAPYQSQFFRVTNFFTAPMTARVLKYTPVI